jgi:hypothetical protein
MEIVGGEGSCGDIGEGEIFTEFADAHLDGCSTILEMPDAWQREIQVG